LGDLPESCVAFVLVYLDPPKICKLAMINMAFRGASSADFVWESKLPPNYDSVIGRVFNDDDGCRRLHTPPPWVVCTAEGISLSFLNYPSLF
jgi:hypothetical protein